MATANIFPVSLDRVKAPIVQSNSKPTRNFAIGYLRAFVVVLVVAHHAALAYDPYGPPPPKSLIAQPRWWQAFPIIDPQHWSGFAIFVSFNDIFFMSLMFLLSGLFVWQSLRRKGSKVFLRDRLQRLGIPFVVAAAVIAPLAYYPAYLQTGSVTGIVGFWQQWRTLGNWPSGPAWFVWVLLVFDGVAALLFLAAPRWGEIIGRACGGGSRRPFLFFARLAVISAMAYLPMELVFDSLRWTAFGPFTFQTARILHYLAYFIIGVGIGAYGIDRGLLAATGNLVKRWFLWVCAALLTFGLALICFIAGLIHPGVHFWRLASDVAFVLSCAVSSFAFLSLFVRFMNAPNKIWTSLSDNSYGIYLVHYAFVSWLQYALLRTHVSAVAKGSIVFLGALLLSWSAVAAIRRIPAVARIV
ncbi:MAG TPA: acyltransferase [Terriglobales bacterium]|jgi:peptidoglycan/LPS O-acetylase OafA/YrhL